MICSMNFIKIPQEMKLHPNEVKVSHSPRLIPVELRPYLIFCFFYFKQVVEIRLNLGYD